MMFCFSHSDPVSCVQRSMPGEGEVTVGREGEELPGEGEVTVGREGEELDPKD